MTTLSASASGWEKSRMLRKSGLWALLIFSIGLLYLGVRMLLSDISGFQADSFIHDWRARGKVGSQPAWDVAHKAALHSINLSPVENGANFHRAGTVHEWLHSKSQPGSTEARESRLAARNAYRQAVQVRGSWPYSWLRLAQVKMELLEFDTEFDHAMRQSIHYGSWRPRVNFRIALIGLTSWHELSDDQRVLILEAAVRSIEQEPKKASRLLEFAEGVHLRDTVCNSVMTSQPAAYANCNLAAPD